LKREVGIVGATMMGLGSMVGTGVFVSIGIAAGVVGRALLLAIRPLVERRAKLKDLIGCDPKSPLHKTNCFTESELMLL
jgi:hypothetical protein